MRAGVTSNFKLQTSNSTATDERSPRDFNFQLSTFNFQKSVGLSSMELDAFFVRFFALGGATGG